MNKSFKADENGELEVSVNYGREDYLPLIERAEKILAGEVTVKGFRRGKAPFSEARRLIKSEDLYNKMVDLMVKNSNKTLLDGDEEHHSVALNFTPTVDLKYDKDGDSYQLHYVLVLNPIAKLGRYTGFQPQFEAEKVGAARVEERLLSLAKEQGVLEEQSADYQVLKGDIVNLDAIGYVDGKSFDGGVVKSYDLEIGSNAFVPGFEDQLIGLHSGDRKNIDIVFPANYVKEYQNKPATFDVTVNAVKKKVYPELDDEFAKSVEKYRCDTLADLKKAIAKELKEEAETRQKQAEISSIYEQIIGDASFVINSKFIESEKNSRLAEQVKQVEQYGINLDDYLSIAGTTREQFDAQLEETALADIRHYAVTQAVISASKMELQDADYQSYFGGDEGYQGFKAQIEELDKSNHDNAVAVLRRINNSILASKVETYLLDNNPGTGKKPAAKKAAVKEDGDKPAAAVKKPAAPKPAVKKSTKKADDKAE